MIQKALKELENSVRFLILTIGKDLGNIIYNDTYDALTGKAVDDYDLIINFWKEYNRESIVSALSYIKDTLLENKTASDILNFSELFEKHSRGNYGK